MRNKKEKILKEDLRILAIRTRERLGITQKKMAELLDMSESSYSDIETGESMCGTLTTVLLLGLQSEPSEFVTNIKGKFQRLYEKEMQTI